MMPTIRRFALVAGLALSLALPASALAFPLSNCTVTLTSIDVGGNGIDSASSGGADGSLQDPIQVPQHGTVHWAGTSGPFVFGSFTWGVSSFGIPMPVGGEEANTSGGTEAEGDVLVDEVFPFDVVGLFHATGTASDGTARCEGSAWFQFSGNPFATVGFWVAALLAIAGALVLIYGARNGYGQGVLGGLMLGIGLGMLVIVFGVMPVAEWTPLSVVFLGTLLGIVTTAVTQRRTTATVTQ